MNVQAIVAGAAAIRAVLEIGGELARMIEEHQRGQRELTLEEIQAVTSERRLAEKIYAEVCRATGVNVSVGTDAPSSPPAVDGEVTGEGWPAAPGKSDLRGRLE